jgi:hypothetical protein
MKFEIHFEFRASLRKFQDLNFWDATVVVATFLQKNLFRHCLCMCCVSLFPWLLSESKSPGGWRSAPTLNPKMRRGLSVSLVSRENGKNTRTHKDLEWFRPLERNTLLHCVMYCS